MALFGLRDADNIRIGNFQIITPEVKVGDSLQFGFDLLNDNDEKTKIRLEYAIYYQKANGTLTKKVHKISEKEYPAKSNTPISRKHSFKVVTTRKLHPGLHQVAVVINGTGFEKYDFELVG